MQLSDLNLSELFKNAVEKAGWVLDKAEDILPEAIWALLATKYITTSPRGFFDLVNAVIDLTNENGA